MTKLVAILTPDGDGQFIALPFQESMLPHSAHDRSKTMPCHAAIDYLYDDDRNDYPRLHLVYPGVLGMK